MFIPIYTNLDRYIMTKLVQHPDIFQDRHIGPNTDEQQLMLSVVGASSLDELISQTVPPSIHLQHPLQLTEGVSEFELLHTLKDIAAKNTVAKSYIGAGYYDTITPPVILRNLMENPGWYTQYTPYQAEIAQGRLESLLNFQTMVIDLTAMEIANASLLDEATAAAEAMHLMLSAGHAGNTLFASENLFPQSLDVLKTRCEPLGITLQIGDHNELLKKWNDDIFGVIIQYPDGNGSIESYAELAKICHEHKALVSVATDLMALLLLTPPGEWGADVVFGSSQRFGVPMGYGGPHAAFFATKDEFKRQLPGRIIGVSIDSHGNRALRMALQTREQHIRRDKATSNICTAQALLANMSAMYAVYHGPHVLKSIAERIHQMTCILAESLKKANYHLVSDSYFDTIKIPLSSAQVLKQIKELAEKVNINFRYFDDAVGISLDETTSLLDVKAIAAIFAEANTVALETLNIDTISQNISSAIPASFIRTSKYLLHPVFNTHHSETEMLRYLKLLENKDLSLVHSMVSLGSCTMKLNATTEMIPVTWSEFGAMHPFAPLEQTTGYQQIFSELEADLCAITGFTAMSLQPNAGAQGEYAGLLVIRAYQKSIGQGHRNVVLIPASAHGTNPASAVMVGLTVVVTKTDAQGNIDIADLKAKAEQHKDNLSCLMVTYPSTHGVFEEGIIEICDIIHANGGQVYMDGANMNAQVGITSPKNIGADVCHLNLHKTFCIPHGGGGPGMGPIGVAEHLAPFLPGHSVVPIGGDTSIHAISAAPWGSASILLISWAYIKLMGAKGLTDATKIAILNANYIKSRLEKHYPILYKGSHGRVAHEMIVDMREFKTSVGIEVEDIAKRLIDYGFHAPTVSFPVAGTLMIEPTESESLHELDRFCDAMIAIRQEIAEIESGAADKTDNVLKNAPHTALHVIGDEWKHSYSREKAAYPNHWVRENKFWSPVGRLNGAFGDRNLVCACPPLEEYMSEVPA